MSSASFLWTVRPTGVQNFPSSSEKTKNNQQKQTGKKSTRCGPRKFLWEFWGWKGLRVPLAKPRFTGEGRGPVRVLPPGEAGGPCCWPGRLAQVPGARPDFGLVGPPWRASWAVAVRHPQRETWRKAAHPGTRRGPGEWDLLSVPSSEDQAEPKGCCWFI